MEARAILAGPGAARTLDAGGSGRLEIALGAGGYVRLGVDGWLVVASPRAPVGPLSLLVAGLGSDRAVAGWPATAQGLTLRLGPHRLSLAGTRVASAPAACADAGRDATSALAAALAASPEPPPALAGGLSALARGELGQAVALLAGRGDGLTPAGDDILAGYAGWRHAAGAPVALSAAAAGRSSPIGLAYLRCAERGELPQPAEALCAALRAGDGVTAARRARVLRTWGTSSGPALLWGIAAAVQSAGRRARPARGRPARARRGPARA